MTFLKPVPNEKCKNLDPKFHPCNNMSYSKESKAYWLYDLSKQEVIIQIYVIFYDKVSSSTLLSSTCCYSTWFSNKFWYRFKGIKTSDVVECHCDEIVETFVWEAYLPMWATKTIQGTGTKVGDVNDSNMTQN